MERGLTQEDLSEHCGLFRTYMSRIETGQANPTLTMIHALATSLGVTVPELFAGDVAAPPAPPAKPSVKAAKAAKTASAARGRVR